MVENGIVMEHVEFYSGLMMVNNGIIILHLDVTATDEEFGNTKMDL